MMSVKNKRCFIEGVGDAWLWSVRGSNSSTTDTVVLVSVSRSIRLSGSGLLEKKLSKFRPRRRRNKGSRLIKKEVSQRSAPDPHPDPHQIKIWIRIRIKVINWIRIRLNLQTTSQNIWNMSLSEHLLQGFEA
jgi:hypothetical protein